MWGSLRLAPITVACVGFQTSAVYFSTSQYISVHLSILSVHVHVPRHAGTHSSAGILYTVYYSISAHILRHAGTQYTTVYHSIAVLRHAQDTAVYLSISVHIHRHAGTHFLAGT